MKKSRFSEDRMVGILREADAEPVQKVAKGRGVSEQTIYTWRKQYGTPDVTDVRRLHELETENARLKKMVAERALETDVMKDIAKRSGECVGEAGAGRLRDGSWLVSAQGVPPRPGSATGAQHRRHRNTPRPRFINRGRIA